MKLIQQNKICLFTNDVETTSIARNTLDDKIGNLLIEQGMPLLLDAYRKFGVKSTFFFTGYIAERFPELVKMVIPDGHEIGCHGYTHKIDKAFDVLTLDEQINHLLRAKKILEDISGQKVVSFRAPALRVNHDTPIALAETGFIIDSSVASQRFDMFMSFGSAKKLKWFLAPRLPYFASVNDLSRKGNSNILEIPVSAFLLPYIGSTLRMMPIPVRILRTLLAKESGKTGKPVNFLTHPNEFIDEVITDRKIERRAKNPIRYLFADLLRNKLKTRNLGSKAIPLLEKELDYFKKSEFQFMTLKSYRELIVKENE